MAVPEIERGRTVRSIVFFVLSCCFAFITPFLSINTNSAEPELIFPGWPNIMVTENMKPIAMSESEAKFATTFPGKIAIFSNGRALIQIRWITKPTRKLHPASDCFKGNGYRVKPLPLMSDESGAFWGRIQCKKGSDRLIVRERIFDNYGQAWTDVSSWYWSAAFGRSKGPWWAVTIVEGYIPSHPRTLLKSKIVHRIDTRSHL